jgi:hypothetical protein
MKLISHLHLILRLRKRGAIPPSLIRLYCVVALSIGVDPYFPITQIRSVEWQFDGERRNMKEIDYDFNCMLIFYNVNL